MKIERFLNKPEERPPLVFKVTMTEAEAEKMIAKYYYYGNEFYPLLDYLVAELDARRR